MLEKRGIKLNKKIFFIIFIFFAFFYIINSVDALNANITLNRTNNLLERNASNLINFSIGAMSESINLVQIYWQIQDPGNAEYYVSNTNGTNGISANFNSYSPFPAPGFSFLNFTNSTVYGIIPNGTIKHFWFNMTARNDILSSDRLSIFVNATGNSTSQVNNSVFSFAFSFSFSGYTRNETGCSTCWQNGTNVTLQGIVQNQNGPPTQVDIVSGLTNGSGYFKLMGINATYSSYKLKTIYYNSSNVAMKVGSILPEFPANLFYPSSRSFDMTLDGATFYLQQASTLRIYAYNDTATPQRFGYEISDKALGFTIASDVRNKLSTVDVVVPSGRNYNIMINRQPGDGTMGFSDNDLCENSNFMNDTLCPTPPRSNSSFGTLIQGQIFIINQSLATNNVRLHGCINIASGNNNSAVNITNIYPKILPWEGFVPSTKADTGQINLSNDINTTYPGCFAYYNISLMNSVSYMIEFYAKNASNDAGNPGTANTLAIFQNLTTPSSGELQQNLTLYKLLGSYTTNGQGAAVNISMIKINIQNASGGAITTNMNANLKVKHQVTGTVYYIISSMSNGVFYFPILNNTNWAKLMVFSNNAPPMEKTINLTSTEFNITLISMSDNDKGFRKMNSTGGLEVLGPSTIPVSMRLLRNTAECSTANAPSGCVITEMNGSSFNPLKALVAGSISMELKITETNVSMIFNNYDMMSAKQPPMFSILDKNASSKTSSASAVEETWNFGSFAPVNSYSNVTINIPYSDNSSATNYLNDAWSYSIPIPVLYNENQNVVWNRSRGDTSANLTDDFIDYNNTMYNELITSAGTSCSSSNLSKACFINTSGNYITLKIPHFSSISPSIVGSAPTTSSPSGSTTGSGSSASSSSTTGGANVENLPSNEVKESESITTSLLANGESFKFTLDKEVNHILTVLSVTKDSAKIRITSDPIEIELKVNEEKQVDLDNDKINDISIKLESIVNNMFAKFSLKKLPKEKQEVKEANITVEEKAKEEIIKEEQIDKKYYYFVISLIILIILFFIFKKKKTNN